MVAPIVVGGIGIGAMAVPLTLSAIAGVGVDQIGPVSAIALMLQKPGGPVVLAVVHAVTTCRTLYLGGTTGPVKNMNAAQVHALDQGYTHGPAGDSGGVAPGRRRGTVNGHTAEQVAHVHDVQDALDPGEL